MRNKKRDTPSLVWFVVDTGFDPENNRECFGRDYASFEAAVQSQRPGVIWEFDVTARGVWRNPRALGVTQALRLH
jgi:hypothetical protein